MHKRTVWTNITVLKKHNSLLLSYQIFFFFFSSLCFALPTFVFILSYPLLLFISSQLHSLAARSVDSVIWYDTVESQRGALTPFIIQETQGSQSLMDDSVCDHLDLISGFCFFFFFCTLLQLRSQAAFSNWPKLSFHARLLQCIKMEAVIVVDWWRSCITHTVHAL